MEVPQNEKTKVTGVIEMNFKGDTRIEQVTIEEHEDGWASIQNHFRQTFMLLRDGRITARRLNAEGEFESISADAELRVALSEATNECKSLYLEFDLEGGPPALVAGEPIARGRPTFIPTPSERERIANDRLRYLQQRRETRAGRPEARRLREKEKAKKKEERAQKKAEKKLMREQQKKRKAEERELKKSERMKKKRRGMDSVAIQDNGDQEPLSREERKLKRQEMKIKRKEGKEQREQESDAFEEVSLYDLEAKGWPAQVRELYLDGNNMMYLTSTLRNLTLNRSHHRGKAERLLEEVMRRFLLSQLQQQLQQKEGEEGADMEDEGEEEGEAARMMALQNVALVFDNTRYNNLSIQPPGGRVSLRVCSARPSYPSSDDALIERAKQLQQEGGESVVAFVTSDRALSVQLAKHGGIILRPKMFLQYVATQCQTAGATESQEGSLLPLDEWLASLVPDVEAALLKEDDNNDNENNSVEEGEK